VVVVLLSASLAGACVTVTQLRQSPPVRMATVSGRYLPLATCSMTHMETLQSEDRVRYQLLDVPSTRTATILGVARMPGGIFYTVPEPVFELTLREADDGKVTIESRNGFGGHVLEPRVWPIVEQCAGTKLTPIRPSAEHAESPLTAGATAR
jgi:hypothetical protein